MTLARGIVLQPENSIDVEPDALVLYDLSRYGNNGAMLGAGEPNAVQLPSGAWVWSFDAIDDIITIPNAPSLYLTTFTIHMWVYQNAEEATTEYDLMAKGDNADGFYWRIEDGTGVRLVTYLAGGLRFNYTWLAVVGAGIWRLLTLTYDNPTITASLYVNGLLISTQVQANNMGANNTANLVIGDIFAPSDSLFAPPLIYNYIRSAGQILNYYENTKHWLGVHD